MKISRPEEFTGVPLTRELSEEEVKQAYALARAAFTIEDLLRYTEIQVDLPAEQVLNEMEEAQKRHDEQKP